MLIVIGSLSGAAAGMNRLAGSMDPRGITAAEIATTLIAGAVIGTAILLVTSAAVRHMVARLDLPVETQNRFLKLDSWTYMIALAAFAGAAGFLFIPPLTAILILLFVKANGIVLYAVMSPDQRRRAAESLGYLAFLFLISGFAALIYQIVWQRVLFAAFGVNIESITIIVSLFMFGLGLGSLAGGILASRHTGAAPKLFLACELGIGLFGIFSIPLIDLVSAQTLHGSLWTISLAVFALLALPTMLMGATLPILVSHLHRHYRNVGRSVGLLYCINTLGSAIACFITADILFVFLGQQASVLVAAACNIVVGMLVWRYARRTASQPLPAAS